jgi:hypothetical protein
MKKNKKSVCEEFEKEVFLFQDGSLPRARMELIEHHLGICKSCQSIYEDFKDLIAAYENFPEEDVGENNFNDMISIATNSEIRKGKYIQKRKSLIEVFGFYRLSFGGAAVVTAIILIIISFVKEPNIRKGLPADILDWHGEKITNRIELIEDRILSLKSDKWDIYMVRKKKMRNWDATLKNIRNQIDKMKKATNNREL